MKMFLNGFGRISIISFISFAVSLLFMGCGSSAGISNNGATTVINVNGSSVSVDMSKAISVELEKNYSASNGIEFSLFKVMESDKLQTVGGGGSYYKANDGTKYIDVIITLDNNGSDEFSVRDKIKAYFEAGDGTKYEKPLCAVETRDDSLDQFGTIKPLAKNKVHIGYSVPSNVENGRAYFGFGEELFVIDYDSKIAISNKTSISMNQEVKSEDVASFELLRTDFTTDVLPPNTSGFYTHYEVSNPSNDVYFVVYCNLTNMSSSGIRSDKMISIKAIFDGKYEYKANMALEEKDGTGFDYSSITSIDPLETRKGVFMFEVPKKVKDMNYELSIYFYGKEYSYSK